jgi:hypothetical protein
MMTASEREAKELPYGAPGLSADTQRTTLQATVYSGDGCRRGDAQSLALTTESIPANQHCKWSLAALKLPAQSAFPLSILHEGLNVD